MRRLIAAALACLALHGAASAAEGTRADALVDAADFQGVAIIGTGDAVTWSRVRGEQRPGVPHRLDSIWRLASVTKQLVALIVMQEVAAGRLDLDAPMKSYWPDWPAPDAATITPRMLLKHDSGLADPAESKKDKDGVPEFYRRSGAAAAPALSAAGYCAAAPRAKPGSGYHYNNCDFIVLGALLERLTGKPLAALLQERIAAPLGITSLGLFAHDKPPAPHVAGILLKDKPEDALNLGSYGGAGSAYIAPLDLWAFDRALLQNRLLDRVATAQMWEGDPALGYAAFGSWSFTATLAGCPDPVALIERRGAIGGVQVRNFLAPAKQTAVLLFTNHEAFDFGEVGAGSGFSYDMLSAALCPAA